MAKKKTQKPSSEKKKKPSTGQSGKVKFHDYDELLEYEQLIVQCLLPEKGKPRHVMSIKEIQEACDWAELEASEKNPKFTGKARGNSRVRNALRKLVTSCYVENYPYKGSGKYRMYKGEHGDAVEECRQAGIKPLKRALTVLSKSKKARDRKTKEAEQIAF